MRTDWSRSEAWAKDVDPLTVVCVICGREIEMSRMSEIYIEVYEALERYGYDMSIASLPFFSVM